MKAYDRDYLDNRIIKQFDETIMKTRDEKYDKYRTSLDGLKFEAISLANKTFDVWQIERTENKFRFIGATDNEVIADIDRYTKSDLYISIKLKCKELNKC